MKIKFVVGDWSGDGHEKTQDIFVKVNKDRDSIENAHKVFAKKYKIGLGYDGFFADYEENGLKPADLKKLQDAGVDLSFISGDQLDEARKYNDDEISFDSEMAVELYLNMVKIILPDLEYKLEDDNTPEIRGIGYGLFH